MYSIETLTHYAEEQGKRIRNAQERLDVTKDDITREYLDFKQSEYMLPMIIQIQTLDELKRIRTALEALARPSQLLEKAQEAINKLKECV